MKEILRKIIETTNQLVEPFDVHKTICLVSYFYLGYGNAFNIKFFNKKEEEIRCDVDYHSSSFAIDFTNFLNDITASTKVNSGTLTIYHSGEYESDFVWDEQAHIDYLTRLNEAYQDSISEEFAHQFRDLSQGKTFTKGIVITDIINNEVKMETFFYDNQTLVHQTPMLIDAIWIETILQVQINLQNSELGINIINWNRMIMDIPWSETDRKGIFDVKRDVKFEWREENA